MKFATLVICIFLIQILQNAHAQFSFFNDEMKFELISSFSNEPGWISAEGRITAETPHDFEEFLIKHQNKCIVAVVCYRLSFNVERVVFNSTGGDLLAAIELGRLIRASQLSTSIGKTSINSSDFERYRYTIEDAAVVEGICESACAYAFLGGVSRHPAFRNGMVTQFVATQIGVHQFHEGVAQSNRISSERGSSVNAPKFRNSEEKIQFYSGLLIDYVTEMGVDPRIVTEASNTLPNGPLNQPPGLLLRKYNVLTVDIDNWRRGARNQLVGDQGDNGTIASASVICHIHENGKKIVHFEVDFDADYLAGQEPELRNMEVPPNLEKKPYEYNGFILRYGEFERPSPNNMAGYQPMPMNAWIKFWAEMGLWEEIMDAPTRRFQLEAVGEDFNHLENKPVVNVVLTKNFTDFFFDIYNDQNCESWPPKYNTDPTKIVQPSADFQIE